MELVPFKGLNGETMEDFEDRLKAEFRMTVSSREDAMINVPVVPAQCTSALSSNSVLTTFVMNLEEELTFTKFL